MTDERKSDRNSIQVIARASQILRLLATAPHVLSLGEIAERTSLARSTVQRIVKALVDEQFLVAATSRGGFKLGPGLRILGSAAAIDVSDLAEPFLKTLAQVVEETVDLSVLTNASALFVNQIAGPHRLTAVSGVGEAFPLHSTANGKAMLSCLSAARRQQLLRGALTADTANTVIDRDALEADIVRVQATGVAWDMEEHTEDVCAIGTGFLDGTGRVHAISIPAPRSRFDRVQRKLVGPLLACREAIVEAIQGSIPTPG